MSEKLIQSSREFFFTILLPLWDRALGFLTGLFMITPVISIIYRIYHYLKYGYNPNLSINSVLDAMNISSYVRFDWIGIQNIFDGFMSLTLEFSAIICFIIVLPIYIFLNPFWDAH